jgi:hypothetical protein
MAQGESIVSPATINARADALEKAEKEAAAKGGDEANKGGDDAAKAAADKAAADKATADAKAAADKASADKGNQGKTGTEDTSGKPTKKAPNDPDELRKWNTRVSQENKKLRDEMSALKDAQEKTFKLLSKISKTPVDYKELAKDPEKLQKFIEEERENATTELKAQLDQATNQAKEKDTVVERMKREHDSENYPEWKRLYPSIVKIAMGPTGQGDPRVDFTKPAGDVLDALYDLALSENPAVAAPAPVVTEKVYKESEMKTMLADMLAKEKDAIAKAAKEEAIREAQAGLSEETKGGTVASAGKGAGRIPSDHLAAFKKMSLSEQREWLIAQQANQ